MNPILQNLESEFAALQAGKIPGGPFFENLTAHMFILRADASALLEHIDAWARLQSDHPDYIGLTTIALCQLAMHEDRIADGLRLASEARDIFATAGDEDGVALSDIMAAAFYRTLGNIDMALKCLYSAHEQLRASNRYPFFFCASSYQLGELYIETGAYDRAINMYQDCINTAQTELTQGFKALALSGQATAYQRLGQNEKTREAFLKAIDLSSSPALVVPRSRAMTDYGTFCMDTGDYELAADYHQRALVIRTENKMLLAAITNMIQLGKVHLLQGKKETALNVWNEALQKAVQIQSKPKMSQVHQLLSELYQSNGDTAQALEHYKAYHQINAEINKEDGEKKVARAEILFAAEQTRKENAIIKAQKIEIEHKNRELQQTIDELTITKVSRRAKVLTIVIAAILLIIEEPILHYIGHLIGEENFYFSTAAKILVILSLKPIDTAIEHYMLHRLIIRRREQQQTT